MSLAIDPRASVVKCGSACLTRKGERYRCNVCDSCLYGEARYWQIRAEREVMTQGPGKAVAFLTGTISDEAMPGLAPDAGKHAYARFRVRLFKLMQAKLGEVPEVKFVGVPEGVSGDHRLHWHGLVFGVPASWLLVRYEKGSDGRLHETCDFKEMVREAWPHGFVDASRVRDRGGIRYVFKYVMKGLREKRRARAEWRARKESAARHGMAAPAFGCRWWWSPPRGRQGGLGRQFAERLARVVQDHPSVVQGADLPGHLVGAGGRRALLTRYERTVGRRALGLDGDAARVARAQSPARVAERVEMAARIGAAGSVDALRAARGHIDDDVASVALAKARMAKSLGRW